MRGAASYEVPERLGHSEAYSLGECAHRQGLTQELKSDQLGGTLIIAPDGHPLAIENAQLKADIVARMLQAGVPMGEVCVD